MGRKKKRSPSRQADRRPPAPPQAPARTRRLVPVLWTVGLLVLGAALAIPLTMWLRGNSPNADPASPAVVPIVEPQATAFAAYAGSESCRQCHSAAYDDWSKSHHALAERPLEEKIDYAALASKPHPVNAVRAIGVDPLRQYLVGFPEGRLQADEEAYDPRKGDWFDVFGDEHRQPGEWGHWTGRGMNWNSMCAVCHNTRLRKNYDPASDSYDTKMVEIGVSCESCHGPMKKHVQWQRDHAKSYGPNPQAGGRDPTVAALSRETMFQTCGSCHARRGELTGDFKPGDAFHDHYRLNVVDETETYYPDGQVHEEDYEFAAFHGSRMHAAGVRCVDCHQPHTGKTVLQGDLLCMRCHLGSPAYPTAPIIRAAAHVFHKPESPGARCVNCHMPQTTYMQRHVRHDHGFTIPDPLLTTQLGIPNACNRCHTDKDAAWAQSAVEKWYGPKMERHSRQRTRWIAAARNGDASARQPLLGLLNDAKETPYWKASAADLLAQWIQNENVTAALLEAVGSADALVREGAARSLGPIASDRPDVHAALEKLLHDPARSVRLAGAWTLRSEIDPASTAGRELLHLMEINADQPLGRIQKAHYDLARGDPGAAVRELSLAVKWDPKSPAIRQEMAVLLSMTGNVHGAITELEEACRLAPKDAEYRYLLGLAWNETGDVSKTAAALTEAIRLDPNHARAWYNLGLARQAMGQSDAALDALSHAESINRADARIPYARATILLQLGRRDEALDAARKSLQINPSYQPARQLLSGVEQ